MKTPLNYRLGLDLGTNSIGFSVIELDKSGEPCHVRWLGSRIFSNSRDPKTGESLAVKRRNARSQRRQRDRSQRRNQKLLNKLTRYSLFPENEKDQQKLKGLDPYKLRNDGLDVELKPEEFGRAVYHLAQRRGFLSNRKIDTVDNEGSAMKAAISSTQERVEESGLRTIGEYLYKERLQKDQSARFRSKKQEKSTKVEYDIFINRAMIRNEFDLLWETQRTFNTDLYSDEAYAVIADALFHQRPLKPGVPGFCQFFSKEVRAPLAALTTQDVQFYSRLNLLKLKSTEDLNPVARPLTLEERDSIVDFFTGKDSIRESVTYEMVRKQLFGKAFFDDFKFTVEHDDKKGGGLLLGNKTAAELTKKGRLDGILQTLTFETQEAVVSVLNDDQLTDLECLSKLEQLLPNVEKKRIRATMSAKLVDGYTSISMKAQDVLLPYLMSSDEIISYATAQKRALDAGLLPHSARKSSVYDKLPYYGEILAHYCTPAQSPTSNKQEQQFGKIGNPTVHVALNQFREVVNTIISQYGKPQQVVLEVARDLKNSKEQKIKIAKSNRENEKLNIALNERLTTLGQTLSRNNREKLRLFDELAEANNGIAMCVYSGKSFSISKLFTPEIEVEHILPYSRTMDNGYGNKTLAFKHENTLKANQSPYEAYSRFEDRWQEIQTRAAYLPKNKQWRFSETAMSKYDNQEAGFIARQLHDTAYISKVAKQYIEALYNDSDKTPVWVIKGGMTALLRHQWGLNSLLNEEGVNIKNRDDHRHHAIDATVIGLTSRNMLTRISRTVSRLEREQAERVMVFPEPWDGFREELSEKLTHVVTSHKQDHSNTGALHEETSYKVTHVAVDEKDYHTVLTRNSEGVQNEVKKKDLVFIKDGNDHIVNAYVPGSNFCYEIWETNERRWTGKIVTTFESHSKEYEEFMQSDRYSTTTFEGERLVARITKDSIIEILDGDERLIKGIYYVQQFTFGMIGLTSINSVKRRTPLFVSPNVLRKLSGEIVHIDPIGRVYR